HFVYHSVLHPQTQEMPHHWNKLNVEEMIFGSGLPFTIVQPTAYMQNLLPNWDSIQKDGILCLPYPAGTRISLVDLNDVAEAAAIILQTDKYVGATLELIGTPPHSQTEVCKILSRVFGQTIQFETVSLTTWETGAQGLSPYARETLMAMFRYYEKFGLIGNSAVLEMVLGRPPATLRAFIERHSQSSH
ncbi:MAG: NmrA family NAD(P)-binding protein, partial [Chloroflexota bacterium]